MRFVDELAHLVQHGLRHAELVEAEEVELLRVFADLSELSRNRPAGEEGRADTLVHSPREHFHTYLQSLDVDRAALSETFRHRLARVLAHYGVEDFERTPALEEAVFRIFLAQQRASVDVSVIVTFLQQWLTEPLPEGMGISQRSVTVSTVGLVPAIRRRRPRSVSSPRCGRKSSDRWAASRRRPCPR